MINIWHTRQKGLTLLELLVTIAVLAVVAAIMMPIVSNIIPDTRQRAVDQAQEQVDSFVSKWNDLGAYTYNPETITWTGYVDLNGDGVATSDEAVEQIDLNEDQYQVEQSHGDAPSEPAGIRYDITPEDTFTIIGANPTNTPTGPQYDPITFTYLTTSFTTGSDSQQLIPTLAGGADDKTYSIVGTLPTGVSFDEATGIFTGPATSGWNFTATQIDTNGDHSCALLTDGTARCWGWNLIGQLGNGTVTDSSTPVIVRTSATDPSPLSNIKQISAGASHTCAVLNDGTARCWGSASFGRLGTGVTFGNYNTPLTVHTSASDSSPLTGVSQISAGASHTCAVLNDGSARCWGWNFAGQLGNGTNTDSSTPVVVSGIMNAVQITTGGNHTCARLNDGTARCWGYGDQGQIGDGTSTRPTTPKVVSGLTGVIDISAGEAHSCAVLSNGAARCWGANYHGQLGDGDALFITSNREVSPVAVVGISNATTIGTASNLTCAGLSDGTARCWGSNHKGRLGDGGTNGSSIPVVVSDLTGVVQVATSTYAEQACALLSDGSVKCWGDNEYSQLGNGTKINSNIPVNVNQAEIPAGFPSTVDVTVTDSSGSQTTTITLSVN